VGTPEGEVVLCTFPAGTEVHRIPYGGPIRQLLFSPDGQYLAIACANTARVWDCQAEDYATPELEHPGPVMSLAFHPRGRRLATGCLDNKARVFAVPTATDGPLFPPVPHHQGIDYAFRSAPIAPAFVDEGRGLLTVPEHAQGADRRLIWRDAESGTVVHFVSPPEQLVSGICAVAVSPDGRYFAVGHFKAAQIWEVSRGEKGGSPLLRGQEHKRGGSSGNAVGAAAFSPDGRTLLMGDNKGAVRRWSVPDGQAIGAPLTLPTRVSQVAFSPDGRFLATAQTGGLIRIWAAPTDNPRDSCIPLDGACSGGQLSPDGRFVLPTGNTNRNCRLLSTRVYEVATGQPAGPSLAGGGIILAAAFSPDGRQVAALVSLAGFFGDRQSRPETTNAQPGLLKLWDWHTGEATCAPLDTPSEPRSLDYSPDGKRLAMFCASGQVLLVNPLLGQILTKWQADASWGVGNDVRNNGLLRFSPDGQSVLTFDTNSVVRVWEASTGKERYAALKHAGRCTDAQFAADGRLLATASEDRSVHIWDVATGQPLADPLAHPNGVTAAVFSRDGTQVLTGCKDGMARLWDWRAGRLVCPALEHESRILSVAFHPNGRWVLTASDEGVFRVWDGRTGKPVTPPLSTGGEDCSGISLAVTPDGNYVVVGGSVVSGTSWTALQVFYLGDLSDAASDLDDLCTWGELLSGRRVHDGSGVTNLTAEEWLTRWREYRQRHPGSGRIEPADPLSYHWREADASEAARQWSAAIPHLDRLIAAHPMVGPLYARRGVAHAELEQWEKALADFTRASELRPDDVYAIGSSRARLCLAVGDEAGYRRVCADLLQRFGTGASLNNARQAVWTSVLRTDVVPDQSQLVRISERFVALKWDYYLRPLGAALYRAGRFEEAIQQLNAAIAARNGDGVFGDWLFLAMAHHRLGHAAEARQWLDKTIQWEAKQKADREPLTWVQRLELQTLLREARELIEGKAAEPKK
jgi:WD40 repeat protein/tetratricopeptide (TPR) repeat protein